MIMIQLLNKIVQDYHGILFYTADVSTACEVNPATLFAETNSNICKNLQVLNARTFGLKRFPYTTSGVSEHLASLN